MLDGKGDSPQLALDNLDAERITFAREMRGFSKKELADKIGKSPSAISQIEKGIIRPDIKTFLRISLALGVPSTFFMSRPSKTKIIQLEDCHFRSKRKTTQAMKRQSARIGDLLIQLMELFESKGIIFPQEQLSSYSYAINSMDDIEEAAIVARQHFGMRMGPIPNITKLMESKGAFVLPIYKVCEDVDAYSTWRGPRPCMMINLNKTAARCRFDIAHELGHLLIHEDLSGSDIQREREADRFGGAFLAPRESFFRECPTRWNYEAFEQLSYRWKMSIQALVIRGKDLGKLSSDSVRKAFIDLSRRGLRKTEGDQWEIERPTLINQALELLVDKIGIDRISRELSLNPGEVRDLMQPCISENLLALIVNAQVDPVDNVVRLKGPDRQ